SNSFSICHLPADAVTGLNSEAASASGDRPKLAYGYPSAGVRPQPAAAAPCPGRLPCGPILPGEPLLLPSCAMRASPASCRWKPVPWQLTELLPPTCLYGALRALCYVLLAVAIRKISGRKDKFNCSARAQHTFFLAAKARSRR